MKKAIVASVIASIVVIIFIQPLMSFLWHFLLSRIGILDDLAYSEAAIGFREVHSFMMFGFFLQLIIFIALALFLGSFIQPESVGPTPLGQASKKVLDAMRTTFAKRLILGVGLFWSSVLLTLQYRDFQLNASFHQRLVVLAPHISEQEYKGLVAAWAQMTNGQDYKQIVLRMDNAATAAGIRLPKILPGARPGSE